VDATDAIDTLDAARLRAGSLAIATELLAPLRQLRPSTSLPTPTTTAPAAAAPPAPPVERREATAEAAGASPAVEKPEAAGSDSAVEKAEAAKARGNAAFAAKEFASAVKHYSMAIRLHPDSHVLWSNRSAAHCAVRAHVLRHPPSLVLLPTVLGIHQSSGIAPADSDEEARAAGLGFEHCER
jgi:hypothetical protein